ncbi:MAG: hypothetical protein HUK04_08370 [Bacteroidaceae bacterium]|nr:hypothetical protein [Bacteroidaceae bacterium]
MKKILFMAIAAVAMVACGGNQTANETEGTDSVPAVEVAEAPALDINALDSVLVCDNAETINAALTQAQTEVAKLVSLGQNAEAYSLADAVLVSIAKAAENLTAQGVDYTEIAKALEAVKTASEGAVAEAVADKAE